MVSLILLPKYHSLQLLKIGLPLLIGFYFGTVFQQWRKEECPQYFFQCEVKDHYKPKTRFEIIRYEYFDDNSLYSNVEDDTKIGLLGYHKQDIQVQVDKAMSVLNSVWKKTSHNSSPTEGKWKCLQVRNGYRKVEPSWGAEYIMDLDTQLESDYEFEPKKQTVRVSIHQPFCTSNINFVQTNEHDNIKVNFIVPVISTGERVKKFLKSFATTFLSTSDKKYVSLMVVTGEDQGEVSSLQKLVYSLKNQYQDVELKVLFHSGNFSRGHALHAGAEALPSDALLFFVDPDILVAQKFLMKCRRNTVKGEQVYYPIVFSQYDPEVIRKYTPKNKIRSIMEITKFTGHWVHYGYGMVCLYQQDYLSVGGFNLNIKGGGGEDVDLYNKHIQSDLQIMRAMEPSLIYRYYSRTCDTLPRESIEWQKCIGSAANTVGNRMQLAIKFLTESNTTLLHAVSKNG